MLFSLAPLPVPLHLLVMSLATIFAADNLFLGSSSVYASFSSYLPLLYLPRGLDALTTTTTVVETITASSPIPIAWVDEFTPINHDNSFMAFMMTIPAIVTTPLTTICYSPSFFVSLGSPLFIPLSESLLIEVWTNIAAVISLAILASSYVIMSVLVLSSPGFSSLVQPSLHIPLSSQEKTQCNTLLQVNQILANVVG